MSYASVFAFLFSSEIHQLELSFWFPFRSEIDLIAQIKEIALLSSFFQSCLCSQVKAAKIFGLECFFFVDEYLFWSIQETMDSCKVAQNHKGIYRVAHIKLPFFKWFVWIYLLVRLILQNETIKLGLVIIHIYFKILCLYPKCSRFY